MKNQVQEVLRAATFGACARRKIGAIAVDYVGETIGEAANGRPECLGSCLDSPCPGANVLAGAGGADCWAVHAEERLFMKIPRGRIHALYSTKAPCTGCTIKAVEHGVKEIYFITQSNEIKNREIAECAGIVFKQIAA
jgi:deoxycytidylate deaminase